MPLPREIEESNKVEPIAATFAGRKQHLDKWRPSRYPEKFIALNSPPANATPKLIGSNETGQENLLEWEAEKNI